MIRASFRPRLASAFLALALAAGPLAAPAAMAQETQAAPAAPAPAAPAQADPTSVVATVGGQTITEGDLVYAAEDLGQELQNIPAEQRKAFLLTVMIDMKVMAEAARTAKLQDSAEFQRRLKYLEDRALRRAFFSEQISTAVTAEAVQTAYNEYVAGFQPTPEVHAAHILVATEDEAKAVKAEIDGGADFATVAKAKSTDPSAQQNGGDLGFFGAGMMVQPFQDAAFAMEAGQVSEPVQSQFGWHVIKVLEKRESQPPSLEEVGPQIQQELVFRTFDEQVAKLKSATTIEIPDAALAAQVQQQSEPAPAAGQ